MGPGRAAGQRHAPQGTRYSPGPGRPVARGLPAGSPAPAPVGGSRTRAQVGGGGLIALTQDGGGGFAASHVVIGVPKRAAPCPWRAGSGPGRLALRCRRSRRFLNPDAAFSGEECAASFKHPQTRAATGLPAIHRCPQPTCPPPPPLEGAVLSRETAPPLLGAEEARGRVLARTA